MNNEDIKTILYCIKYTAEHKFKKDPIAQAQLGELSCKVEEMLCYYDDESWTEEDEFKLMKLVDFWRDVIEKQEGENNGE